MATEFPPLLKSDVSKCSMSEWYPQNYGISIPTLFVPLDEQFIQYLLRDGIVVPNMPKNYETLSDSESNNAESDDEEEEIPEFPTITKMIQKAIDVYGGVFPKMNWSAPKDASWIAFGNTMKCERVSDVLLLLKVSEFITFDLKRAYDLCVDKATQEPEIPRALCLRKYQSINQSREFRCFVLNGKIVAICQRHLLYFPETVSSMPEIVHEIIKFQPKILIDLKNYVVDVVVESKVVLIDIGPFCQTTDPIMFDWNEILLHNAKIQKGEPPLAMVVQNEQETSKRLPYEVNRFPKETFDFSNGQTIDSFAQSITQEMLQQL